MNKIISILFFLSCLSLWGQDNTLVERDSLIGNDEEIVIAAEEEIKIPPLSVFLDAVYDNATVKKRKAMVEEELANLTITKQNWLDHIRINTSYAYGIFSTYATNTTSDIFVPTIQTTSGNRAQHTYNIGATLSFTLGDVFKQKQKRKVQDAIIRQKEYEVEEAIEERKLKILDAYNQVQQQLSTMRAKAEAVALYNAQMKISENDYINGKITIIALSLERSRRSTALVNYEQGRVELHNTITLLELLTNVKIINAN